MRISKPPRLASLERKRVSQQSAEWLRIRLQLLLVSLVVGWFGVGLFSLTLLGPNAIDSGGGDINPGQGFWNALQIDCLLMVGFSSVFFVRFQEYQRRLFERDGYPEAQQNLWTWAYLLFSVPTVDTVFCPLLSDLALELSEVSQQPGPGQARKILRQGYATFWKTAAAQLCRSLLLRIARLGSLRPDRSADS